MSVLIVGAGPAGLVLAIELARRGVIPRVIDAGAAEHRESRAVSIVARSLELLDDLGLAQAAIERGVPLHALNFYQGTTTLAEMDVTAVDSPFPLDLCIPQWQTVALLRDRAEELGVTVEWNTRLVGQRARAHGVNVEIVHGDGRAERCDTHWLIGADGAHSTVRESAGITRERADLRRGFILGDVATDWTLTRDRFHVYFGRTGVLAVFPMVEGYWRILASTPGDQPPEDPGLADFATYVTQRTPLDSRVRDLRWSSSFVARESLADRLRSGRVLLIGDAAHSHSPVGGQGMNTGMQDALNLGWKLALVVTGRAGESLLDSYQAERWPVVKAVVDATSTTTHLATETTLLARRVRRHALRLFGRLNPVQQRLSNAFGEHLVHYRGSALVFERWHESPARAWSDVAGAGPEAGELVRDTYVETRSGSVVALRHLLRPPGHHLVLFGADTTDPGILAVWQAAAREVMDGHGDVHLVTRGHLPPGPAEGIYADPRSEAHNRYGVRRPSLYVIRPDKYVGYRGDQVDFAPVTDYFRVLAA
ncbi:FAD-dependent monooxygenase [Nonomuraea sp. K274]|uniref:FAD-dependent monooxygenase n=1 Tax=Nonomuraea cypriaca TaxID=1187855 RepID=A0A931A908_9ACTN|nr:FAD-dependent monooxygenase [Nonomuraea cypriaca]MBF8187423.1 FAD-dependent monooxygenase [Nonomuraea cypriaca]